MSKYLFIVLVIFALFISPSVALFIGIMFALLFKNPYSDYSKKTSKYLLQTAVVGLGFGMNLHKSIEAGQEGMIFTIISVCGIMAIGYFLGKWLKVSSKLTHLISSGTAICGGSAIAAISPIVNADENDISISLAIIFTLNATALFIFPTIGIFFNLSQEQFGTWAAIAIHDTSSVIGASAAYGTKALEVATTVKLTRALWIIPLSILSMLIFKNNTNKKVIIPWFIILFIISMTLNTYFNINNELKNIISIISHKLLSVTLFLIGSSLSVKAIKTIGLKPIILGIFLWIIISITSLFIIM